MRMRMHNPGDRFQPKEQAKNKKATLLRLLRYVMENYKFSFLVVFACIIVSSVATLTSTLFTQKLIDDYIVPLAASTAPDYSPLAMALFKLAAAS